MTSSERSSFLARLAAAVRAGNRHREAGHGEMPAGVGYVGAGDDPVGRFVEELERVGARPQRLQTRDQVAQAVRGLAAQFEARRAISNAAGVLDELGVVEALRQAGVEVVSPQELSSLDATARRDRLFAADLGVAAPDWAIAETGTLVYVAGPEQTRSATLLPPVHLAVVDRARILPDLFDLTAKLTERAAGGVLPRNVALVTGPSKTGDIELRLTTGVHGPGEVHVVIWEGKG